MKAVRSVSNQGQLQPRCCLRSKRSCTEARKMGREQKKRGVAPFSALPFCSRPIFPHILNAILLLAALLFRSARMGTLAMQASLAAIQRPGH